MKFVADDLLSVVGELVTLPYCEKLVRFRVVSGESWAHRVLAEGSLFHLVVASDSGTEACVAGDLNPICVAGRGLVNHVLVESPVCPGGVAEELLTGFSRRVA